MHLKSGCIRVVAFGGRNLIRGLVPLDGGNLLVFNNLNASEFWLYKGGDLWWEEPYKRVGPS
jgi:hypothetical protein